MSTIVKIIGAVAGLFIGPPLFGFLCSMMVPLVGGLIGGFFGIFIGPVIGWLVAGELWEQYRKYKNKGRDEKIEP